MSNILDDNKIFPKSVENIQCVSQCYDKGTDIVHPTTLQTVTNINKPFCAVMPFVENNETILVKECELTNKTESYGKIDLLTPILNFDHKTFLNKYYKITDVSDFYIWLQNNKMIPVFTKMRIIDCFIISYGKNITIIDDIFSEAIIDIIKRFLIKKMYGKLCVYIGIKNGTGVFIKPESNKLKKSDNIEIRTKFLFSKLISLKIISEISNKYFTKIGSIENNIKEHNKIGIDDFINFLNSELKIKIIEMM